MEKGLGIEGPFELHVVIEVADEPLLQRWLLGVGKGYQLINPKLTGFCAFYGEHPIHLMLSCFIASPQEYVSTTNAVVVSIRECGIRILRVKLESNLHAKGVPRTVNGNEYYEVHIKVPITDGLVQWDALAKLCRPFDAHLFINNRSKSQGTHAIVTVRRHNTTYETSDAHFTGLVGTIASTGQFPVTSVRAEYSFYDTNTELDRGWLFDLKDAVAKTEEEEEAEFFRLYNQ